MYPLTAHGIESVSLIFPARPSPLPLVVDLLQYTGGNREGLEMRVPGQALIGNLQSYTGRMFTLLEACSVDTIPWK